MKQWNRAAMVSSISIAALLATSCGEATDTGEQADDGPCASLEGETVTLVVPFSPGGGFDTYARMVAPELGDAIDTQVVVENRPGAGGLVAMSELLNAPSDGTRISIMDGPGVAYAVLAEAEGAEFALDDFSYLGRVADYSAVAVTSEASGLTEWDEVLDADQFRFGVAGRGSSDFITAATLIEAFDLPDEDIVTGFDGQSEVVLSLLQGNVESMTGPIDSRLPGIQAGDEIPLLSVTEGPSESLPDTASLAEVDLDEYQQMLMDETLTIHDIGRPLIGPGDMEEDPLTCLRDAMSTVLEDEAFLEEAEEQGRPISFYEGANMQEDVRLSRDDFSDEFLEILEDAFG